MSFNPFTDDPKLDLDYPPDQQMLVIESEGFLINGFIEIAQGQGPHATILLLHGFPGTEKNADLAHVFRRAGFNVVIFSYRGSWGSKGSYTFKHCAEDCENVVKYLQINHNTYRINKDDIIIIGTSFGGFLSLYTAFKLSGIHRVASVSGFHLDIVKNVFQSDKKNHDILVELFNESMNPLNDTSPDKLFQEILAIDSWDFTDYFETLSTKDLCLISALKDEITPPELYHFPLIEKLEKYKPKKLFQTTFYDAQHSYSDHRVRLTKVLLDWLLEKT